MAHLEDWFCSTHGMSFPSQKITNPGVYSTFVFLDTFGRSPPKIFSIFWQRQTKTALPPRRRHHTKNIGKTSIVGGYLMHRAVEEKQIESAHRSQCFIEKKLFVYGPKSSV